MGKPKNIIRVGNYFIQIIRPGYSNHLKYKRAETRYDSGINFRYGYNIWKRINLFVSGGLEFSNSKHYFRMTNGGGGYHVGNIEMSMNRHAIHYGLNKHFNLYNNKVLIDLGIHIVDRYYASDSKTYSQETTKSHLHWIDYDYELETHHGEYLLNSDGIQNRIYMYLNLNYSLDVKFNLAKNLYFNFGVNYTRNNIFFYNFTYTVRSYQGGFPIPTSTYVNHGIEELVHYGVRDHFLYLNSGLTYTFNWKK